MSLLVPLKSDTRFYGKLHPPAERQFQEELKLATGTGLAALVMSNGVGLKL
jgi:hypothetical protein